MKTKQRYTLITTRNRLASVALGLFLNFPVLANTEFNFTTYDVPGSTDTFCDGNSTHAIAGQYYDAGGNGHGFVLKNGVVTSIDVPGAAGDGTSISGIAANGLLSGIWDDGTINTDGSHRYHAFFLSKNGDVTTLDPPGAIRSEGGLLNAQGQVSGFYRDPAPFYKRHAFIWDKGSYTIFNVPGDHPRNGTGAFGINDRGQVVGWYHEDNGILDVPGNRHGFLRSSKGVFTTIDPPVPAPANAAVTAINNAGQIVGYYFDPTPPFQAHGFFLSDGIYTTDINVPGAIDTWIFSINQQGEIAGFYDVDVNHDDVPEFHCYIGTPVR